MVSIMKVLDSHSDIFYDLFVESKNVDDPFLAHERRLSLGEVVGGIWVIYSDHDFDVVEAYRIALEKFRNYQDKYEVVFGLEGLRNVPDLKTFETLYKLGIRHASLTWNEENHLAGGAKADPNSGLTETGKDFVHYMNQHNMIVDVSHLNEKSFYEVVALKPKLLIASHSNSYEICPNLRNLKDAQLLALKEAGGLVGVVAAGNFVSSDQAEKNLEGLIRHIDYLVKIMGIERVMFGFDMMNYLNDFNNSNLLDFSSHEDVPKLVRMLLEHGYSESDVTRLAYTNLHELIIKTKEKNNENN